MSKKTRKLRDTTVADFCTVMEEIAPTALAQDWDNVGLLAGDPNARLRRVMLCIDLTPSVVEEALRDKVDLVMAYHPPIFKPIASLRASSLDPDAAVFRCIRGGIAIYSTHTALDAAPGGMNDVLASLCGATRTLPLDHVDDPKTREVKVAVFVPQKEVERVADAMFASGAGRIGDYDHCSFRLAGTGSFFGGAGTHPTVGRPGRVEYVDEVRLETVVPADRLAAVVGAMRKAHSYEEPAFDVYPLQAKPVPGIGRVGLLPRSTTLRRLAGRLKRVTKAPCAVIVGSPERCVNRAIVVVGAAGSLPLAQPRLSNDAIITGEIRHHDALRIQRVGCSAVALGHWSSERPGLIALARRLTDRFPSRSIILSSTDREPFQRV